jgi:hypothetical protein
MDFETTMSQTYLDKSPSYNMNRKLRDILFSNPKWSLVNMSIKKMERDNKGDYRLMQGYCYILIYKEHVKGCSCIPEDLSRL